MASTTLLSLSLSLSLSLLSLSLLSSPASAANSTANSTATPYPWWNSLATLAPASGGACGYGNLTSTGYGQNTTAVSPKIFLKGGACGACYQVQCRPSKSEYCQKNANATSSFVTVTNLCTGTNSSDGFCNLPRARFVLSTSAFTKIAMPKGGIVSVRVRRVPCVKTGGIAFTINGNAYFLLVLISNVGGSGDIKAVDLRVALGSWVPMYRNYGAVWSVGSGSRLFGSRLSFRIRTLLTNETLVAENVAPRSWKVGSTYYSTKNFSGKNSTTF